MTAQSLALKNGSSLETLKIPFCPPVNDSSLKKERCYKDPTSPTDPPLQVVGRRTWCNFELCASDGRGVHVLRGVFSRRKGMIIQKGWLFKVFGKLSGGLEFRGTGIYLGVGVRAVRESPQTHGGRPTPPHPGGWFRPPPPTHPLFPHFQRR